MTGGDAGLARGAATEAAAFRFQAGAGGGMNGAANAAAPR